jgi:hypothetical protein
MCDFCRGSACGKSSLAFTGKEVRNMSIILSIVEVIAKAGFTALVQHFVSRTKERTDPTAIRDGSDVEN